MTHPLFSNSLQRQGMIVMWWSLTHYSSLLQKHSVLHYPCKQFYKLCL